MKITCPGCQWSAEIPEEKIPVGGVMATCRKCQTRFPVSREATAPVPPPITTPVPPLIPEPPPEFTCPKCGTPQAEAAACRHCGIIFAKYAEKQCLKEAIPPTPDDLPGLPVRNRFKGIALAVAGLLAVAVLFYRVEIVSAAKLFLQLQPDHARHIPRTALSVTRCNVAAIFLKTGLKGATDDPVYRKLLEYGGRLYPRFTELLANPVKESGIDLAEDVYAFTELQERGRPRMCVLFGIRDRGRFAEFLHRLKPETPTTVAGVSSLRLDNGATLYWNSSFALIYPGGGRRGGEQRALAIMAMKKEESIVSDPLKKRWLEGTDDCLVSVDLEKIVSQPHLSFLAKSSPFNPEVYRGSALGFAFNFVKGKATFDARVTGAPLLAEISSISAPPAREFLESLPADKYLLFLASHIPFASIVERGRRANPEQFRQVDGMVEKFTTANLEQLAASFTGDIGMVLEGVSRRSSDYSSRGQYPGYQPSRFLPGETKAEGSIVIGVMPDSVAVMLLQRMLQEGPEARNVRRDGRFYRVDSGNGYYILADNGYIALSTDRDVISGLAERKKGDRPAIPAGLLERCSGTLSLLELKLSPLFAALAEGQSENSTLELLKNNLAELRVASRLEKDQVSTRGELLFSDETRNSLYQIAKLAVTIGESKRAVQPQNPGN